MRWKGWIRVELHTQVATLEEIEPWSLEPYDAIYLGHPYCRHYRDNLLADYGALREAIAKVRGLGKRVYLSTPAAPTTEELPAVRELVAVAMTEGIDAVEAHNLGVIHLLAREFPGLVLHAGCFANVYTHLAAMELARYGVTRVTPNFELSLEEIDYLREASGLDVTLWLHGKIPLGITRDCFLRAYGECPVVCREDFWLRHRDWTLKCIGTVVLSGQDLCMVEHLGGLLDRGYKTFCISTLTESPAYRRHVGLVYRRALGELAEGRRADPRHLVAELRDHSDHGFCNGYFFGRSGRDYVGAAET